MDDLEPSSPRFCELADVPDQARALLRASGPDATRFLDGLLSCSVQGQPLGRARHGALLTVKGRIVSEVIVLPAKDGSVGLLVPASLAQAVCERLDRHIVMDEVTIAVEPGIAVAIAWGAPVARAPEVRAWETEHPVPGTLVLYEVARRPGVLAGFREVGIEEYTRHRIASGRPAWGQEVVADRFPAEVGFDDAVDHHKGCFMGQEPIARLHARGHVNWVMVRVEGAGSSPAVGPLSSVSRPDAGRLTSVARREESFVGLAIVHRELAVPGQMLTELGGTTMTVSSGPLGSDPGVRITPG